MKAGIIKSPGVLKLIDLNDPSITKDDEVIIEIKRVGICGSDMHILHGTNPFASYPCIWGHEFAGKVIETGRAVKNNPKVLKQGYNEIPGGENIYFINNPALGLWVLV